MCKTSDSVTKSIWLRWIIAQTGPIGHILLFALINGCLPQVPIPGSTGILATEFWYDRETIKLI
jgi:hypothetical protein